MSDIEPGEDAAQEGDAPFKPGSARAALAHREFTTVWLGSLASNVGTWMQNVALGVLAYRLEKSASFVAVIGFAQLGPLLILSPVGGVLADIVDRRRLLITAQFWQMAFSLLLAAVASGDDPSRLAIVAVVTAVGVGNALNAPAFSAVLPALVGRRDLTGAVSLMSVQMNVSRVVGPAIGGLLLPVIHEPGIFVVNAATYFFAIGTLLTVRPPPVAGPPQVQGWRRLVSGFAIARRDALVGRCLLTIAAISFFCLPFIGLMPVLAGDNLGIDPNSSAYGWLYACFGLGAALGAVGVGTVLVGQPKPRVVRLGLSAFAVLLLVFGLLRTAWPAYPVAFLVGLSYFTTVTALSTHLQQHLDDAVRGRVMALWIMGFGGTVPIGLLVGGAVASRTSVTTVVVAGAFIAAALAAASNLRVPRSRGPVPAPRS